MLSNLVTCIPLRSNLEGNLLVSDIVHACTIMQIVAVKWENMLRNRSKDRFFR